MIRFSGDARPATAPLAWPPPAGPSFLVFGEIAVATPAVRPPPELAVTAASNLPSESLGLLGVAEFAAGHARAAQAAADAHAAWLADQQQTLHVLARLHQDLATWAGFHP